MLDQILEAIIKDLGIQGLLIVGLYFILHKPLKSISESIETINHNSTQINGTLKAIDEKIAKKKN